MDGVVWYGIIAGICVLVLLIVLLKQRARLLLDFLVRVVLGTVCIIFANDFFTKQQIALEVGLNPVCLLTAGILGLSGVALLYAIAACKFL